jgi:hypothetical protein
MVLISVVVKAEPPQKRIDLVSSGDARSANTLR